MQSAWPPMEEEEGVREEADGEIIEPANLFSIIERRLDEGRYAANHVRSAILPQCLSSRRPRLRSSVVLVRCRPSQLQTCKAIAPARLIDAPAWKPLGLRGISAPSLLVAKPQPTLKHYVQATIELAVPTFQSFINSYRRGCKIRSNATPDQSTARRCRSTCEFHSIQGEPRFRTLSLSRLIRTDARQGQVRNSDCDQLLARQPRALAQRVHT